MKKSLIAVISLLAAAGCIRKTPDLPKGTVIFAVEKAASVLDPRYATDSASVKTAHLIYSGLMKLNDNMEMEPDLADSVSNPDNLTYNISLKKGVLFHNGAELTTEDVIYTYRSIMAKDSGSPYKSAFDKVESIKKTGKYSLVIKLKEPFAPFKTSLSMGIVPKNAADKGIDLNKNPIGTGPFRFMFKVGDRKLALARFDKYYGGRAAAPAVLFKAVADDTVRALEVKSGKAHMLQNDIPPALLKDLKNTKGIKVVISDGINYSYIGFNLKDPILGKKEVRKAIAYAINRQAIIKHKLMDTVTAASSLLSPVNWAYYKKVKTYPYNPGLAKKLLDKAGYPDPDGDGPKMRFNITYKTSTNPLRVEIARVIADDLRKVGIGVTMRTLEWGVFYDDVKKGNFQMFSLSWTGVTSPDHYYYCFHSKNVPPRGANRGRYHNPKVDELLEEARTTLDRKERKKLYAQVQYILSDDLPYISLWHEKVILVAQDNLKGYKPRPNADYEYLKYAHIEQ